MTRSELLSSREYWIAKIQLDLFNQIENYMTEHQLSRTQLAEKLDVTKGYVSQILNGDFDHKISKLVDLALLMEKVPKIDYVNLQEYINQEVAPLEAHIYKNTAFPFMKIIPGDQIQNLSYPGNEEKDSHQSSTQWFA